MTKKLFILGLGAQKAGTSWLYDQLSNVSNVFCPGPFKEYHYFDSITCSPNFRIQSLKKARSIFSEEGARLGKNRKQKIMLRASFYESPSNYFDHFLMLSKHNPERSIFADFTPTYAGLDAITLSGIKDEFTARGFTFKCIFLMREPLERAWSAVNYDIKFQKKRNLDLNDVDTMRKLFEAYYPSKRALIRASYDKTISNISSSFADKYVHYEFFEDLFSLAAAKRLQQFLELDSFLPSFTKVVNGSTSIIKEKAREAVGEVAANNFMSCYENIYSYVYLKFGDRALSLWK